MRLSYILVAAASILCSHHDSVSASAGNDFALATVTSLGFLQLIGADKSTIDKSQFLRDNKITENDSEERGILDAKSFVEKLFRMNSFSELEKIDKLTDLKAISAAVDDKLAAVFKFADEAKMRPDDLARIANKFGDFDDALKTKALELYTKYWNTMH
ncbi:hypothetical protein F444_13245 [Phytophthora nicotianae P1976]|uniref:RxLR effector protein n=1 Tax=Phytophthora nicotianae P1976 TaxID=1317066 RepID=A0A080ZUF7_PHYNI|nr:hypothetical protein F444_13245 [Phytophthora nicotianae P1976]